MVVALCGDGILRSLGLGKRTDTTKSEMAFSWRNL